MTGNICTVYEYCGEGYLIQTSKCDRFVYFFLFIRTDLSDVCLCVKPSQSAHHWSRDVFKRCRGMIFVNASSLVFAFLGSSFFINADLFCIVHPVSICFLFLACCYLCNIHISKHYYSNSPTISAPFRT